VGINDKSAKGYYLNKSDLLIARTENTVGKSYIHTNSDLAVYAGYLIKLVFNPDKARPKFVFWFTKSKSYRDWLQSMMRVST